MLTNIISMQWLIDADSSVHVKTYVPPNSNSIYPPSPNNTRIQWTYNTDITQFIEKFKLPPNETFPPAPLKAGIEWSYSENSDDFTQWFNTFVNKILIYNEGSYCYFNSEISQWESVGNNYTKELFDQYGMSMSTIINNLNALPSKFEIVTWTNDIISESKQMSGIIIPHAQLVYTDAIHKNYGNLQSIISNDISELVDSNPTNVRYLLTSDNINWQTWNGTGFEVIYPSNYKRYGITANDLTSIDLAQWKHPLINVGIYLEDSNNNSIISKVDKLEIQQLVPTSTPHISNINLYILNTTARIDITLEGTVLRGILSDADLGRVQYRLVLNNQPYRQDDTDEEGWCELKPSPYNINVNLYDKTIIIPNDNNTVRIEFRDAFGAEDYWESIFFAKKNNGKFTYAFIM